MIRHPYVTEKASIGMDAGNKLQFLVDVRATKDQIKREIEETYDVTVIDVKTMMTKKGKKAIVTLSPEDSAEEIATRLGIF
ncbi:MAG: 50S ribosomal protein L23 [Methanocellales archaeon]|nr:50S ribosomal protein L23 [Methanocellales archaeon]MDI6858887.1 50S ribosomal protein L23 [Methanocellales archaeon]MDI6903383.1 50S ribosomal protein L23 [Methanocellales archaeon]